MKRKHGMELNQKCIANLQHHQLLNPVLKKLTSEHQLWGASEQEFALSSQEHQKILNLQFLSTKLLAQYPVNSFRLLASYLVKR